MKSKVAILLELGKPLIVDYVEIPSLEVGQVLVRVMKSGICGAQINEIFGHKGKDKFLPHLLGHEGAGIVVDIGPGVTHVEKEDHVVMHWREGVGIRSVTPFYKWGNRIVGAGYVTTFNEYAVVSENRLTPVQKDLPFDVVALMGCAVTTALGLINNEAQLRMGQSIAVAGCGGVGLNIIQGADMVSGYPIIAIDKNTRRLHNAVDFGASYIISTSTVMEYGFVEDVRQYSDGGVDVFVDCTGNVNIINDGYKCVRPGGKMVLVGQPHYSHTLVIDGISEHYCGKTILDSQGGLTHPSTDIPRYLKLFKNGRLKLSNLVTDVYPLEKVNEAIELIQRGLGKTGRVLLDMEKI